MFFALAQRLLVSSGPVSPVQAVNQRMAKLRPKGSAAHRRPPADVMIKAEDGTMHILAKGHLDEVQELRKGGTKITGG